MKLKGITGIVLTFFLASMITFLFNLKTAEINPGSSSIKTVETNQGIIRVPQDYEKIQWAVGNASSGDIIWVASGTYYEHVVVNKKVEIVGENRSTTIIDGGGTGEVVLIDASYAKISNFTIQHGENGFLCNWVDGNLIIGNIIRSNSFGVYLTHSKGNTIDGNLLTGNHHGIYITSWSEGNAIIRNTIISCRYNAIITYYAFDNVIIENSVIGNPVGIELGMSSSNKIYHNNFINNEKQVTRSGMDIWDNGYPSGGNYWSDYKGVDEYSGPYQNETGSDGIGDTPYIVHPVYGNKDKYPLMNPWFPVQTQLTFLTLHRVNLYVSGTLTYGSSLKVKFYSYSGVYQGVVTVWNGTTPSYVLLSMNITHPLSKAVENVTLVLTDDAGTILQTITTFLVHGSHLMERLAKLNQDWVHTSPEERTVIFREVVDIDMQWPYAPP